MSAFRRRLWWSAFAVAAVSQLLPYVGVRMAAGAIVNSLIGQGAFAWAHRRTQREAQIQPEPSMRVASLASEDTGEPWLDVLDWLAMLVPPLVPASTLIFLATSGGAGLTVLAVIPVLFCLTLGLACSANHWALRFRARSSDWAPTSYASHQYRTYLGVMLASAFTGSIGQLCGMIWMQAAHVHSPVYLMITFPAVVVLLIFVWRMRRWLASHIARDSSDPMPDTRWKWGLMYYNPSDPALIVPLRTGIGFSFNFAYASVWVATGLLTIATLVMLFETLLRGSGRT